MSAGGSSYITEGAHHAWLLSANRDTLADPPKRSITPGQLQARALIDT